MAMKKAKKTKKPANKAKPDQSAKPAQARRKYANDTKGEAKDLYLRGVGLDRIGRYLGVPIRTLTNWQTDERWTEEKDPAGAALDLKQRGYRVADIATRLEVSEKTVRMWLKAVVQSKK
ncbi:MAG: hypothetical protein WCR52_12850 [Bacteroidota bacterium]